MPARSAVSLTARTQKSPRGAGLGVRIGASTRSACNTLAGDLTYVAVKEQTKMPIYSGTRAHVSATPARRPSAFRLSGVA